jgi:hypothetical protein
MDNPNKMAFSCGGTSMRRSIWGLQTVLTVLCLAAGTAASLGAGDKPDPKAIIQKAIDAMGGEEKLARYKGSVTKGKCTFYGMGRPIACTGEWYVQLPRQLKAVYQMDMGGKKATRIEVVSKDRGWTVMGGKLRPIPPEQLAEIYEGMEAHYALTLLPLKDPTYRLAFLGESEVQGQPTVGLKVSKDGHRDVLLYFDKEHGYLLKMQTRVKGMGGTEQDEETIYGDYHDFDGVRSYKKMTTKRDGKPFLESEANEYKAFERLPDSTFDKPEIGDPKRAPSTTSTQ